MRIDLEFYIGITEVFLNDEGFTVYPSDLGNYATSTSDFKLNSGFKSFYVKQDELIAALEDNIENFLMAHRE